MKLNNRFELLVYGPSILEAKTLDMILSACHDGQPRPQRVFYEPSGEITQHDLERKMQMLLDDGFLKTMGHDFIITSKGMLHLSKGGYLNQVKKSKRADFPFWLSIIALLMSLTGLVASILDS
ncbi:MAG TPA: hypothetical protein PLS07_00710 [Niabella sp.]|nr:hypothetical protein [Niabella sp.]HQW14271.1 hypothetical protein [Niabella sp.]HQX18449.1 hypothetical protein [Niabella sp.]HQX40059.1 hypothetical protein [Niabella sp.]HRB05976.1 hypothetical protein [Niabella sp.]